MRKVDLKRIMAVFSVILIIICMPLTVLADGLFEGDIIITNVLPDYEYKIYEVLDVGEFADDTYFKPTDNWKDFVQTYESAADLLIPDGSGYYTVNMEASKEDQRAFAKAVMEYAGQNGIAPNESKMAEEGAIEVSFTRLMLGIYVIDTAGRPRLTIMWDMDWKSEIKESYKPEDDQVRETTQETNVETESEEAFSTVELSVGESITESSEVQTETESIQVSTISTDIPEINTSKADVGSPVIIVVVLVAVIVVAALFIFKKKK